MIWNNFGSRFYIWVEGNTLLTTFIALVNPWFMPILFVLAGMSTRYALEKRTAKEFVLERINKLLIPAIFGILFLVPFQTLYARKYFYHYKGEVLKNYIYYFSHLTNWNGYDGAFTVAHIWFILYLFLISMVALPIFMHFSYNRVIKKVVNIPVYGILLLFIPIWFMYFVGNIGGFSIGKNFALFITGYYILSKDTIIDKLEKNIKWLLCLWITGTVLFVTIYYNISYYDEFWATCIGWISILVFLVWGKKFLNKKSRFTVYFNKASYPIYLLHQSILVVLGYYVIKLCSSFIVQVLGICIGSFALTVLLYHVIRTIPFVRRLIGMK